MAKKFNPSQKWLDWKEALTPGKNPCYRCRSEGEDRSGDNFHYFSEERGGHCYKCEYTLPSEEILAEIEGDEEDIEERLEMAGPFDLDDWREFSQQLTYKGRGYRGISDAVNKAYGVRYEYDPESGDMLGQYCPVTTESEMTGVKIRYMPKDFDAWGSVGKDADLFGQYRYRNHSGKFIVVTAGEVDCLSAATILASMNKDKRFRDIPVVSPTIGESGAYKQLQAQYNFLNRFDNIIICFDNDTGGDAALDKLADVLPRNKMKVMKLDLKDTNMYIWDKKANKPVNRANEWISAFWEAKEYAPPGAIPMSHLYSEMIKDLSTPRLPYPEFMTEFNDAAAGGTPLGTLNLILGPTGGGKTTFMNELVHYWIHNSPYQMSILSLEATPGVYFSELLSREMQQRFSHIKDPEERMKVLQSPEAIEASNRLMLDEDGNSRAYLVNSKYMDIEEFKERIEEHIIRLGSKVFILDVFTNITDRLQYQDLCDFMGWIEDILQTYQIIIFATCQPRKSALNSAAWSRGGEMTEEDIKGGGIIAQKAASIMTFSRDKTTDCPIDGNTIFANISKLRHTGNTGGVDADFLYKKASHMLVNRRHIPGMPIGKPPKPDKDGEVIDDRPIVGRDLKPVKRDQGPSRD